MSYDYFKVFSNEKKLDTIFLCTQTGKKRFIFIFDEGDFCEAAIYLGYSAIYIGDESQLESVAAAMSRRGISVSDNIIFPLCGKNVTNRLAEAANGSDKFITGAWRSFYTNERTREFYRIRRDELERTIKNLVKMYTVKKESALVPLCFADIETRAVDWLWEPYIAKGCISILFAEPGAGKTFFTCWLASLLSKGEALPGALPIEWETPKTGKTLFLNAEDSESHTLKPRLVGCGAVLENVYCLPGNMLAGLDFMSNSLENTIAEIKPDLVVFDPMQSFLGANVDMNRANQTRPIMAHLAALAEKYSFAALLVCHSNKSVLNGGNNRLMGSQDIKGAARSVIFLGVHPQKQEVKAVFQIKNNLGMLGESLAFKTAETKNGTAFNYCPEESLEGLTYENCMDTSGKNKAGGRKYTQKQQAMDLIEEMFKQKDKFTTEEMKIAAEGHGIVWNTFYAELKNLADYHKISYCNKENYYTYRRKDFD